MSHRKHCYFLACGLLASAGFLIITSHRAEPAQDAGAKPAEARQMVDKAVGFLKTTQGKDGSFSPRLAGPGITAVVVAGLVRNGVSPQDPGTKGKSQDLRLPQQERALLFRKAALRADQNVDAL